MYELLQGEEFTITNNIVLTNLDKVKERIMIQAEIDSVDLEEMKKYIIETPHTCYFFTSDFKGCNENDKKSSFLFVETGFTDKYSGKPLFLSLIYNRSTGLYKGFYVGTEWALAKGLDERGLVTNYREGTKRFIERYEANVKKREGAEVEQPKIEYNKFYDDNDISSVAKELFPELYINNWRSISGIDKYLKALGTKAFEYVADKKTDYYIENNAKSIVINTGLLSKFGGDILIKYKYHAKGYYIPDCIIKGKQHLLDENFTEEDVNKRIKFIDFFYRENDRFLNIDITKLDIERDAIIHILEDNIDRFPDDFKALSSIQKMSKIKSSLEDSLELLSKDSYYAKPIYSSKMKQISWLLPLHINTDLLEEPEMVFVINKKENYYCVRTVFKYNDMVKDSITALSLYSKLW